jgi:thioester reductase-like protein
MDTIFFTGVPGFLGSSLLPVVLGRAPNAEALCLVQPKFMELAGRRVVEMERDDPSLADRIRLVEGDITVPGLGVADADAIAPRVTEIFHLAAAYDLAIPRAVGVRVNVDGTRNMLDFAASCPRLARFQYVSTCYVSGRFDGVFTEADLERGQHFNNYYEETKYLAEVLVRDAGRDGLPVTVYRPAIVVGDSRTGATQKYDGPYTALRWLLRQPKLAVMVVVGDPKKTRMNIVPRDFVVEAIAHLSGLERSRGVVYQLADRAPLTIEEILRAMAEATGRRMLLLRVPVTLGKAALRYVPGLYPLVGIQPEALDYMTQPTSYATTNADRDLMGTGIEPPPFRSCIPGMARFVAENPSLATAAMV